MDLTPDARDALDSHLTNRAERFQASSQASFTKTDGYLVNDASLEMRPMGNNLPHGTIPNTPAMVSSISFLLGGMFVSSLTIFLRTNVTCLLAGECDENPSILPPMLGLFMAAWSFFHWAEFTVTAQWNREKVSVDSFLLDNGYQYHLAHGIAMTEYIITVYLFPQWKSFPYISALGVVLVIVGQSLRSLAMVHAATNFSHQIAYQKTDKHRLVTDGVYAWLRHPSYTGFYYWALGTQLVLQNPISFVLYAVLLWRFFFYRVRSEERALINFFGDDYVQYRKKVGTLIPFVP